MLCHGKKKETKWILSFKPQKRGDLGQTIFKQGEVWAHENISDFHTGVQQQKQLCKTSRYFFPYNLLKRQTDSFARDSREVY